MRKQLTLNIYQGKQGGRRPDSGRPRLRSKGVAHRKREKVNHRTPLHINFKDQHQIRNKTCLKILKKAIQNARQKGLRIIQYSLQSNHVHLLIEATDNQTLTKGMRSLTITFAKRIQKGRIQFERYHLHVLRSLRETRNALHYVVFNHQKHTQSKILEIDEFTSLTSPKLAREYIKKHGLSLLWKKGNRPGDLDQGKSYFLLKIESQLIC
jgi:REP element-mobilizing transposase RayT